MSALLEGRVWVVDDAVNTDAMYPGFAMKLPLEEAARFVLHELRPGWTDQVASGDILVAGRNFGVGSSRPVASLLALLGVQAVVADEFNSLFYRNCINLGMPALTVPGIRAACHDGDIAQVDLVAGCVLNTATGATLHGPGLPPMMIDILDAGGLMPRLAQQGYLPA